jgi:ArsR family transcriptional regulator
MADRDYGSGSATASGDDLLNALSALASPYRLRIIAALAGRRQYVSQLAREIGMSRPLLHMHLRRLQSAGFVDSELEISDEGKAMNFYSVAPFALHLTPEVIGDAVRTLTSHERGSDGTDEGPAEEED